MNTVIGYLTMADIFEWDIFQYTRRKPEICHHNTNPGIASRESYAINLAKTKLYVSLDKTS